MVAVKDALVVTPSSAMQPGLSQLIELVIDAPRLFAKGSTLPTRLTDKSHGNTTRSMSLLGQSIAQQGVPKKAAPLIFEFRSQGTRKQYHRAFKKWDAFCSKEEIIVSFRHQKTKLFLADLFNSVVSFSARNSARSAPVCYLTTDRSEDHGGTPVGLKIDERR